MTSTSSHFDPLVKHYERCFAKYGETPQGVDWPTPESSLMHHKIMTEFWKNDPKRPLSLLDVGCGFGGYLDVLDKSIDYVGVDLSSTLITAAKKRHPEGIFFQQDVCQYPFPPNSFDYIILNGVLTEKQTVPQEEMILGAKALLDALFPSCRKGLAFNVMSPFVNIEREDLFHLSLDKAVSLVMPHTRHVVIRHDYPYYDYTVYAYRNSPL